MALHLHKWGYETADHIRAGLAAEAFINAQIPDRLHGHYAGLHRDIGARDGLHAANRWLLAEARQFDAKRDEARFLNWIDDFGGTVGRSGIIDDDLRLLAESAAAVNKSLVDGEEAELGEELAEIVEQETGIQINGQHSLAKGKRLSCDKFWRRQIRKAHARRLEEKKRASGEVTRNMSLYVSDEALALCRASRKRNKSLLEQIQASNDEGMECTLQELSDKGVSNPEIRRNELMTRIRGFEEFAKVNNHVGLFFTLTAPSKYHATTASGRKNKKWNGSTPRDAQQYLRGVWAKIRAKWKRDAIAPYGFRIAEPHQDGTPHWHLLLFVDQASKDTAIEVFREYAIAEDREELTLAGKKEDVTPRFKVVSIDWHRGSAAGYIAKYVCKNIDGKRSDGSFVEGDSDEAKGVSFTDSAERVRAWASTWGIRQFQQIGKASVVLWRELRRVETEAGDVKRKTANQIKALAGAADSGDWAKFFSDVAGKENQRVALYQVVAEEPNRYGETGRKVIKGVQAYHFDGDKVIDVEVEVTRFRVWVFEFVRKAHAWTGVNNCTGSNDGREVGSGKGKPFRVENGVNFQQRGRSRTGVTQNSRSFRGNGKRDRATKGGGTWRVRQSGSLSASAAASYYQ